MKPNKTIKCNYNITFKDGNTKEIKECHGHVIANEELNVYRLSDSNEIEVVFSCLCNNIEDCKIAQSIVVNCIKLGNELYLLPREILELLRKHTSTDEYVDPSFLQEITTALSDYYDLIDYDVDRWVQDMYWK